MYTRTIELPTDGRFYKGTEMPSEVILRSMKTKEEKMIYGSDEDAIVLAIKECVVEPKEGFELEELISPDITALMLGLRIVTYGPIYKVTLPCPNPKCKKENEIKVDLTEFEFDTLPEDFVEPFVITLPRSGDELSVRLLRYKDLREVDKWAKSIMKKSPEIKGDISYILRLAKMLVAVNGVDFPNKQRAYAYAEEMDGMDSGYFWHEVNKIRIGFDTMVYHECRFCGEDMDFDLPVTPEFFRPYFEDERRPKRKKDSLEQHNDGAVSVD